MKKEFDRNSTGFAQTAFFLLAVWGSVAPASAVGQPPPNSVLACETLVQTGITLSVTQQPLGELLPQLLPQASRENVSNRGPWPPIRSLWLDRQIDPGVHVSLTAAATPAAKVILEVAEMNDLAVFPLPGVLIVGRPGWVDSAVSHLTSNESSPGDLISVRWPTGSTAAEVLALLLATPARSKGSQVVTDLASIVPTTADAGRSDQVPSWLPHDIWTAGSLVAVDRRLAVELLLAQFRNALRPGTRLETLTARGGGVDSSDALGEAVSAPEGVLAWSALPTERPFTLAYPSGDGALAIRSALSKSHPRASIGMVKNQLLVNTTAENHRLAMATHWRAATGEPAAARQGNVGTVPVFDLQLVDKPAVEVLRQLAQAAGKSFQVDEAAESAGNTPVTLDAKKKTLQQLAQLVAEKAGLEVQWGDTDVIVRAR